MNIFHASDYSALPAVHVQCPSCTKSTEAFVYSRAFSSYEELICEHCGAQRFLTFHGLLNDYFEKHAEKEGKSKMDYLCPCTCGGRFVSANFRFDLYHCPGCSAAFPSDLIEETLGIVGVTGCTAPYDGQPVGHPKVSYTWPGLIFCPVAIPDQPEEIWDLSFNDPTFTATLALERKDLAEEEERRKARQKEVEKIEQEVAQITEACEKGIPPGHLHYSPEGFTFQIEAKGRHHQIDMSPLLPAELLGRCKEWEQECRVFTEIRYEYKQDGIDAKTARESCPPFKDFLLKYARIEKQLRQHLGNRCTLTIEPFAFMLEEETYTRIGFEHYGIPPPVLCLCLDGIFLKHSPSDTWCVKVNIEKAFPSALKQKYREWASLAGYFDALRRGFCIQSNPEYRRWINTTSTKDDLSTMQAQLKVAFQEFTDNKSLIFVEPGSSTLYQVSSQNWY